MVRRTGDIEANPVDRDERLGEAIEAYLALAEAGQTPDPATFAAGYPDLEDDLFAALEGLALVQGLVGGPGGPGHRLESGRRVAGYRIVRELGRGGMGVVYEAVHVGLDRPVALKVLGSNAAPDSSGRRRFLNEARTAAGLHHTHIVPVFDVGQVGGLCYYAMQRIEGSGLDRVIKHLRRDRSVAAGSTYPGRPGSQHPTLRHPIDLSATGAIGDSTATWAGRPPGALAHDVEDETTPFEPPRGAAYYRWVAGVGRQAAEALAHAHQRGVIHRDVKPSNLLVDARGVIWMADFGLARRLADPSQTQVDSLLGTPRYMSPEQARTGPIDGRTDVYSLGATLYELLTLRPPFEGRTAAELIDQIAGREPAPPRQFDPKLPRDLETIVLKALHKRPGDRYETADDLADDLERFVNHEPVRARRIGPVGRAWRIARRHPSLTIVSAVAAATVIASSTIAYVRVLHERDDAQAARQDAQEIAVELERANLQTRSALRSSLIQNAEVVRMSSVADRRATGLGLLKQAAALATGPDDGAKLRDEAVAFLAIRDVENRPDLPIDDRLQAVVFGDDGGHLATLSEDGTLLRFWDVRTRALVDTQDLGGPRAVAPPSTSGSGGAPRGRGPFWRLWPRVVASGPDIVVVQPDGKGLRLFDAATGVASGSLRPFEHAPPRVGPPAPEREFAGIVASADGRRFVTIDRPTDAEPGRRLVGQAAFRVHLWDAANPARPLASLYEPKVDPKAEPLGRFLVPLVAIAPDGSTIAVAEARDSEIALWSRDGKPRDTIDSQTQLTALALGPEGLLAAAGNRAVQIWDLTNARSGGPGATWLAALTPNQGYVDNLRFGTEDATILAVSGRGTGIELWDVPAATRVATLPVSDDWQGLALSPRGDLLAVGQPSALTLWGVVNPLAQTQIAGFKQAVSGLAFSAAGDLAMASRDGVVRRWSAGHCAATARVVESVRASAIAYDADGRLLVQERDRLAWLGPDSQPPGLAVALPELPPRPGRGNGPNVPTAPAIARTPDGRVVAMTRFHEILLGRISSDGRPEGVVALAPSEPAEPTPTADAFHPTTGGPRPARRIYRDVALAPAGDRVYVVSFPDEAVSAFAIQGDRLERLPWTLDGRSTRIALSPDGSTLAIGDRAGVVLLVHARTGAVAYRLAPPADDAATAIDALAFAPDGRELAVGSRDQVRLWALEGVRPRPFVRLPGHRGSVLALAYAPGGQLLASGGEDRTVRVWDLVHVRGELAAIGLD